MTTGLLIVTGPITTATRLEKKLHENGNISARVVHTPAEFSSGGCSYSVRTSAKNLPVVLDTVKKYKIKIKKYYLSENSDGKEVYHALS